MVLLLPEPSTVSVTGISLSEVPFSALGVFEGLSRRFILPDEYKPGEFTDVYRIEHANDVAYGVRQLKTYLNGSTEELFYIVQCTSDGDMLGRGEARFAFNSKKPFFRDKPFEEYTGTEGSYRRNGLGIKRTCLLNVISKTLWNLPLHSSTQFVRHGDVRPAKRVWEKLVAFELAIPYLEKGKQRYVFRD